MDLLSDLEEYNIVKLKHFRVHTITNNNMHTLLYILVQATICNKL